MRVAFHLRRRDLDPQSTPMAVTSRAKVVNRPEAHAIDGAPARSSVTLREAESPVPNRRTARRYERPIRALILDSRTPALAGKF